MFELGKFILIGIATSSFAAYGASSKKERSAWINHFIYYNKYLSQKVDETAHDLDLFISRKSKKKELNKTTITLRSFGAHYEGGKTDSSFNFDVNLRLPNTEEKWRLRFSSYDTNEDERGIRSRQQRLNSRERSYGAGVALMQDLGNIKTSFQPRIELRDPLQTSYTLKFESNGDIEPYKIVPRLDLFADSEKGVGQFLSLHSELSLSKDISIIQFNEEQYENFNNKFSTTHGFSIARQVGKRKGVNATISFYSFRSTENRGYHLSDLTTSLGYSSEPLKRIFVYRLGPSWRFTKNRNFKGEVGFSVEFDLIF